MKTTKLFFFFGLFVFVFFFSCTDKKKTNLERKSIYPFLSGDTFRSFCRFQYDEEHKEKSFSNMKEGDTIFVNGDLLDLFFEKIHPKIPQPYVLVTHNSDHPIPYKFYPFLNDPKLIAWFGQNIHLKHPKLHPIPIGIANAQYKHGDIRLLGKIRNENLPKKYFVYLNFLIANFPKERGDVFHKFCHEKWCYVNKGLPFEKYLRELAQSKFALSPRGNGLDCHKTWEALYLGVIPIVKTSELDPLFKNLPVLIVKDWDEVNEDLLNKFLEKTKNTQYQKEKLFADFWINQIESKGNKL